MADRVAAAEDGVGEAVVAAGRHAAPVVRRSATATAAFVRTRIVPVLRRVAAAAGPSARRFVAVAVPALRRTTLAIARIARRVGRAVATRLGRWWVGASTRTRAVAAGGTGVLVVAAVLAFTLTRGNPFAPGPGPSASPTPGYPVAPAPTLSAQDATALLGKVLPTPAITGTALLVANPAALTATEQRWIGDLRASLGNVDPVAYREATADRLRAYFTVFVVDQSADLDAKALAVAFDAGVSIHLAGAASTYAAQVSAGVPK